MSSAAHNLAGSAFISPLRGVAITPIEGQRLLRGCLFCRSRGALVSKHLRELSGHRYSFFQRTFGLIRRVVEVSPDSAPVGHLLRLVSHLGDLLLAQHWSHLVG